MSENATVEIDVDTTLRHRGDIEIEFAQIIWPKIQEAVDDYSGLDALDDDEAIRVTGDLTIEVETGEVDNG